MRAASASLCLIGAVWLVGLSDAAARPVRFWEYSDLMKEADLVVIGQATQTEDATNFPDTEALGTKLHGVQTTFKVTGVLKGKHEKPELQLLHYAQVDFIAPDGPALLEFQTKGFLMQMGNTRVHSSTPEYMLFLKARDDGRYEPVTGQIDAYDSAREMFRPLPVVAEAPPAPAPPR